MQELRNILVPTDFSPGANNALVYAINLAEQINAHLYIAHIQDDSDAPLSSEQIDDRFEQIKHDFLFRRTLRTSNIVRNGSAADELNIIIKEKRIDLMVMGMRGASGRQESNFGSLTTYFIDNPACTLLSVPADCLILTIKQMAVASDYKIIPEKSEIYALSYLAQSFSSKMHIFNVRKTPGNGDATDFQKDIKEIFKYNLISFYEIDEPSVVGAIRNFIDENNIDLLSVFHKVNTQKDPLKRSVSKQLAFVLRIPLLIVPIQL